MTEMARTPGGVPQWSMADRLRKSREYAGMDQSELADAMGVGRNTVSNYERGTHAPREIVLRAWALATGVPLDWIKTGRDVSVTERLRSRHLRPVSLATNVPA